MTNAAGRDDLGAPRPLTFNRAIPLQNLSLKGLFFVFITDTLDSETIVKAYRNVKAGVP